jgi:hypothetical protein
MLNQRINKEVSDPLEAHHVKLLEQATTLGRNLARRNIPKPTEDSLSVHVAPIRAAYRNMLALYVKKTTGNEANVAALGKSTLELKQARLQTKLKDLEGKEQRKMLEAEPFAKAEERTSLWWIHVLILCTGLFDAILTRRSLSVIESNNNVTQVLILIILTAIFVAIPYGLMRLYHKTKHSPYRFIIWGVCLSCIIGGLAGFAILRAHYLNNVGMTSLDMNEQRAISISPFFLSLLQVFALFIGVLLAFLQPSPEETHEHGNKRKTDEELKQIQAEIRETEATLNTLPDQIYRYEVSQSEQVSNAAGKEARIRAMYEAAVGAFGTANTNFRTDHMRADCLDQPLPEL